MSRLDQTRNAIRPKENKLGRSELKKVFFTSFSIHIIEKYLKGVKQVSVYLMENWWPAGKKVICS